MRYLPLVGILFVVGCSDNVQSNEWEFQETAFDWRMDWPMSFHSEKPEMTELIGPTCFFVLGHPHPDFAAYCEEWGDCDEYWATCDSYVWRDSLRALEENQVDFSVSARPPRFLENVVGVRHTPLSTREPWESCSDAPCAQGFECSENLKCVPAGLTTCERLCDRYTSCYGELEDCEVQCAKMFEGPCDAEHCPVSENSREAYLNTLEHTECEEIRKWDAFRLPYAYEVGTEVFLEVRGVEGCTREDQVALQQREAWLTYVSTDEARALYNECAEHSVCDEKMSCLRERGLVE